MVTQFWDKGLGLIECDLLWLYLRSRQVRKSLCGSPEQACEGKKEEVGMILIPARRVHVARDQVGEAWDASRDSTDQPSFQTSTGTRVVCVPTRRQSEDAAFCASNGVAVYLCAGRRERDDFEMGGRWASDWDIPRDSCSGCRFLNVTPPPPFPQLPWRNDDDDDDDSASDSELCDTTFFSIERVLATSSVAGLESFENVARRACVWSGRMVLKWIRNPGSVSQ